MGDAEEARVGEQVRRKEFQERRSWWMQRRCPSRARMARVISSPGEEGAAGVGEVAGRRAPKV